ncbi:MAG: TylF/MycF/NovP-related O-methyltransferase [Oscillospiraceae bacterium]
MATKIGSNRYEGDFGMPKLPGVPLAYDTGDFVRQATLELLSREIYGKRVAGAAAEVGVYRGAFASHLNRLFFDRRLYLFDTFEGFHPEDIRGGASAGYDEASHDWSGTSPEEVLAAMSRPQNVVLVKGRFPESAVGIEDEFCLVSLDADLYQPTLEGLHFFWKRLSKGGYIMLHDYNNTDYPGAAGALREFCAEADVTPVPLPDICGSAVLAK